MEVPETEDEQPPLPTSRIAPSQRLFSPSAIERTLPVIFFSLRLLSVVPSVIAMLFHLWCLYRPPKCNRRLDFALCLVWDVLTVHQCLSLTNGLFRRWRVYYPTFATVIRLSALQFAICWPATYLTLKVLDHGRRPLICWTVIGTTTCISKAVQLWVTSNLRLQLNDTERPGSVRRILVWALGELGNGPEPDKMYRSERKRWDWNRILKQCVAPAAAIYVLMAWALLLNRDLSPPS